MAIIIPASNIYRLELKNSKKNAITSVSSTYKMPNVVENVPITNVVSASLWKYDGGFSYIGDSSNNEIKFPQNGEKCQTVRIPFKINGGIVAVTHASDGTRFSFRDSESNPQNLAIEISGRTSSNLTFTRTGIITTNGTTSYGDYKIVTTENGITSYGDYEFGANETLYIDLTLRNRESTQNYFESVKLYITGTLVTFENVDKNFGDSSSGGINFVESENTFRQTDTEYDASSFDFADTIIGAYGNGRATAIIEVAFSSYVDNGDNKWIGYNPALNYHKPIFDNGDVVIPRKATVERDGDDLYGGEAPALTKNGKGVEFVVLNNSIVYRGGNPRQILYCIEKSPLSPYTYSLRRVTPNTVRQPDFEGEI